MTAIVASTADDLLLPPRTTNPLENAGVDARLAKSPLGRFGTQHAKDAW